MATFAQWTKAQEKRDDSVGYFAKYWDAITPGKISSVAGVLRRLEEIESALAVTDDDHAKTQIGAAMSGYHLAVKEYHAERASEPQDAPKMVSDEELLRSNCKPLPQKIVAQQQRDAQQRATSTAAPAEQADGNPMRYTGWPDGKLEKILAQNERLLALADGLMRQNGEILAMLRDTEVAVIDWPGLYAQADMSAVP